MSKSKPEKVFKVNSVSATIWANVRKIKGESVRVFSVQIAKSYKDNDEWKTTNIFSVGDLPAVETVAREAFKFINLKSREPNQENS